MPRYISHDSELYQSLFDQTEMKSFGLDLAKSPAQALGDGLGQGLVYALLVVALAGLYFLQQRMVAARAAVSPTMSPTQQKIMQYLPVAFAIFQVFFLAGLIIYYMAQAILRIGQQAYITRRFYGHDESLGRQAQRAGEAARELAKEQGGGGGLFSPGQARDLPEAKATATGRSNGKAADQAATPAATPGWHLETDDTTEEPSDPDRQGLRGTPGAPSGRARWRSREQERAESAPMSASTAADGATWRESADNGD